MRQHMESKPAVKRPRMADHAMMGDDPALLGNKFNPTRMNVAMAFNWYNYYFESKDSKKWVADWIKLGNQGKPPKQVFTDAQVKAWNCVKPDDVPLWVGVTLRMLMAGCPMPEDICNSAKNRVHELLANAPVDKEEKNVTQLPVSKDLPVISRFEEVLDEFYNSDYKNSSVNPYELLKEMNAKPSDGVAVYNYYKPLLDEVSVGGEGYEHLTTRQKNRYVAFLNKILEDAKLFSSNMRKTSKVRKPRRRKVKSAEQLTAKAVFKEEDSTLKLVSLKPSQIVGAQAVWLYNSKKRELTYLEGTLTFKGTTVGGFDAKKSFRKRIRKPETIGTMMKMGKVSLLKEVQKLKVQARNARGRLNKDTLVLRVIK